MNKFGFFYYSQKREKILAESYRRHSENYFVTLTGRVVRYNEWVGKFPFLSNSKWDDQKFVGVGWYHHSEYNGEIK